MQANLQDEFLALHDAYADAVFRMCYGKTSNRDEARDMTQETFVRLWERLGQGAEIGNLRAFLFAIARNLIKDYYKKRKPVLERDMPEGAMERIAVASDAAANSDARIALAAIAKLPDPYREVVMLHLVEGIPVGEIAGMLEERPNTVSVRLKRGLEKIRAGLRIETP